MNLTGGNSAASIQSYLFGSIVTITWDQVVMLAIFIRSFSSIVYVI